MLISNIIVIIVNVILQGFTFPVVDLFLEDILDKTHYKIKTSESDIYRGNSKRRRREQDSKKDELTALFEACPKL